MKPPEDRDTFKCFSIQSSIFTAKGFLFSYYFSKAEMLMSCSDSMLSYSLLQANVGCCMQNKSAFAFYHPSIHPYIYFIYKRVFLPGGGISPFSFGGPWLQPCLELTVIFGSKPLKVWFEVNRRIIVSAMQRLPDQTLSFLLLNLESHMMSC
ncbi:hypothetical protein AMECASPLE_004743 [Ameca splendens]|uniref:Uncharacterized protein n=1 Tax=Ameca splendens TaxID=208324 RepID=A0ABV0YLQ2_9TELE